MVRSLRFYMDEHVPASVTAALRLREVDVLTVQEADRRGQDDEEQLAFARTEGRVVVTHDADFLRLHAAGVAHAGIAFAAQTMPVAQVVRGLMLLWGVLDAHDMVDHVEFL